MSDNRWIRWFVLYMALAGGNYAIYHLALPVRVFHHVMLTAVCLYWLGFYGLPKTRLMLPLVVLAIGLLLSVQFALDSRVALESAWHWITNLLLFLMLIQWIRQGKGQALFNWQFAAGGVLVASMLIERLLDPTERPGGAFFLVNLAGAYCAALTVPTWVWLFQTESKKGRVLMGLLAYGLVFALLVNQSRGAFLSVAVAAAGFALLRARGWQKLALTFGVTAIASILIFVMSGQSGHASGDELRLDLWSAASEMVDDHPVTGVGVGLFGQAYRSYRGSDFLTDDNMTGAHSLPLNIAAELGFLGTVGAVAVGLAVLFLVLNNRQRTIKQDAVLAALAGVMVHMLADNFPAQNFSFLVALYAAYLVAGIQEPTEFDIRITRAARLVAGVGLALFFVVLVKWDYAQFHYERSLGGSLEAAEIAVENDPTMRLYSIQRAALQHDRDYALSFDPTLSEDTDLVAYAMVAYGRFWR